MSHHATNWAIQQKGLAPATKIVLWFLADCHNPVHGCFPSQAYLAKEAEMGRSTVNRHLSELEQRGLIRRVQRFDPATKRALPTRYYLACEPDFGTPDVATRVPNPDTALPADETPDGGADGGAEAVEDVWETEQSRVPSETGSVSHSSETVTCKEPISPLPPITWDEMLARWGTEQLGKPEKAMKVFGQLPAELKQQAIQLAAVTRASSYQLNRPAPTLADYLARRMFTEFAGSPPPIMQGLFRITPDRPEWQEWIAHYRRAYSAVIAGRAEKNPFLATPTRHPPKAEEVPA